MDRQTILKLQQMEFFLLHDLVVNELRIIRRSKRVTPAQSPGNTAQQRMALVGRLFRSFLEKVFPRPLFRTSKRPYFQEFTVTMDRVTVERLRRINAVQPDLIRTLQPTAEEIGLFRFGFPSTLTISVASSQRRGYRDRYNCYEMEVAVVGVGRHCAATKAVLAWKKRLDAVLSADDNEMVGPPEPKRNQVQEQLEAVLREAAEAGRL